MKSLKYTKLKPVILALGTFSSLYSTEFMSETGKPGQQFNDKNRCIKVLHDSGEPVLRRRAFRNLLRFDFDEAVRTGETDPDPEIRAHTVYQAVQQRKKGAAELLERMSRDSSEEVGMMLVCFAPSVFRRTEEKKTFLAELIKRHPSQKVRAAAARKIGFNFERVNVRLSENPAHDHEIMKLQALPLPSGGWRFMTDPSETGHLQEIPYFSKQLDDSKWPQIRIDNFWEEQGFRDYDGIAWYRIRFTMPPNPGCNAVELAFGAVDESAWVWLNGKYIGKHDIGPDGWKVPFWLDVTREIRFGGENLLAVRVKDTEKAGGIWKPVTVDILK